MLLVMFLLGLIDEYAHVTFFPTLRVLCLTRPTRDMASVNWTYSEETFHICFHLTGK